MARAIESHSNDTLGAGCRDGSLGKSLHHSGRGLTLVLSIYIKQTTTTLAATALDTQCTLVDSVGTHAHTPSQTCVYMHTIKNTRDSFNGTYMTNKFCLYTLSVKSNFLPTIQTY